MSSTTVSDMGKLCIIYNFAADYRKGVFTLLDSQADCVWYFGKLKTDIKPLDLKLLRSAHWVPLKKVFGEWYWQNDVVSQLFRKDVSNIFALGELYSLSLWALLLLKPIVARKKKVYLWSHGWYGRENRAKTLLKRLFFALPDGSFFYGDHARNVMAKAGGNVDNVWVIHNSLDYDTQLELRREAKATDIFRNHFGNENPNLIFLGRLTPSKKLDLAIEAIARLQAQGQPLNLTIVGNGSDRERLERYASEKGVNVWFYGECYDQATNSELLTSADLCISPGNVGLTAIHSMMFGTPVITHDHYPNQGPEFEAIHPGTTGDFFKENSVDDLARAISGWFARDNYNREATRRNCYDEIDRYWNPTFQVETIKRHIAL